MAISKTVNFIIWNLVTRKLKVAVDWNFHQSNARFEIWFNFVQIRTLSKTVESSWSLFQFHPEIFGLRTAPKNVHRHFSSYLAHFSLGFRHLNPSSRNRKILTKRTISKIANFVFRNLPAQELKVAEGWNFHQSIPWFKICRTGLISFKSERFPKLAKVHEEWRLVCSRTQRVGNVVPKTIDSFLLPQTLLIRERDLLSCLAEYFNTAALAKLKHRSDRTKQN